MSLAESAVGFRLYPKWPLTTIIGWSRGPCRFCAIQFLITPKLSNHEQRTPSRRLAPTRCRLLAHFPNRAATDATLRTPSCCDCLSLFSGCITWAALVLCLFRPVNATLDGAWSSDNASSPPASYLALVLLHNNVQSLSDDHHPLFPSPSLCVSVNWASSAGERLR